MLAALYDLECEQGSTFSVTIFRREDDEETPVDLSGYTARMKVKASHRFTTSLVELTTENSRIVLEVTPGQIDLRLTPTVTTALPAGTFVYDLELDDGAGMVSKILRGKFIVRPEVTK